MPDRETYVIVGASLTGARAAEALRKEGFEGRIVLVGAEAEPPYERPPLSKEYLRGEVAREKVFVLKPEAYEERAIELRLGVAATRLDARERTVELADGERLPFEKLLLATGGRPRRLAAPGGDLEGVYYLRTIEDSDRLAQELRPGRRAVVIGAGFIGSEVAASARMKGLEVTVLEMAPVPLERVLGATMGEVLAALHRERGVDLVTGDAIERFEGSRRVERVVSSSGKAIDCDFAVVGVGIEPAVELAQEAGLAVDNGIVVDEYCETSVPGIYAAGDVANAYHPVLGRRLRVEHWNNAQKQGQAAAKNMLGKREPYEEIPWFWSDQYDVNLQLVGHAEEWDETATRGDVAGYSFTTFYLRHGKLQGALAVNKFKDIGPSRALIRQGAPVDAARLRDEGMELKALAAQGA
jgi:3-phenylpropionate/trans-cinnamate dioxygenase ferredoxin reductase subunit